MSALMWNAWQIDLPTWKVQGLTAQAIFESLEGVVNSDARVSCYKECVKMCYKKYTNMVDVDICDVAFTSLQ